MAGKVKKAGKKGKRRNTDDASRARYRNERRGLCHKLHRILKGNGEAAARVYAEEHDLMSYFLNRVLKGAP